MSAQIDRRNPGGLGNWLPKGQFLGGKWIHGKGSLREVSSPADGRLLATIADASTSDLDAAVEAGLQAQKNWSLAGPLARAAALKKAASRLREHSNELAMIDALDCGNPLNGMLFDVSLGATLMEFFAGLVTELKGETIPQSGNKLTYVTREPLGVVARLVPFNHPVMFAAAKIAAPLAAGNAVILKPSEETPLSALRMAELVQDIFPSGLLSVLTGGAELGTAICNHPDIRGVGLIGSVQTGRAVLKNGADTLKRTQLELGGKNALIICEDADLDAAIAGAIKGMNLGWTAGQSCGSTSRVLVHSTHYEQVVNSISEKFNAIVPGHPALTNTQMGCLSTKGQYERVTGFITRAQNQGARIAAGGIDSSAPEKGYYVRPTLICDIGPEAEIANEEVFGPVLCILPWHDESEMLNLVNGLEVGLTASVWTRDLERALRLTQQIEAGYIWVNDASDHYLGAPFGGVKQSGLGREECLEEMFAYTEARTVTIVPNMGTI
ncbi:MAG: aldehyde dehydrogenase family protein [Paracoccaceae bacterium]|jgi:betaine-aldehyde dehydrogenase